MDSPPEQRLNEPDLGSALVAVLERGDQAPHPVRGLDELAPEGGVLVSLSSRLEEFLKNFRRVGGDRAASGGCPLDRNRCHRTQLRASLHDNPSDN